MTFYVRVKEVPKVPDPKFITKEGKPANYVFYYENGTKVKAFQGETLDVPEGKTVYVHFRIQNFGGKGDCQVWAYDKKSDKYIGNSGVQTLDTNDIFEGNFSLGTPPAEGWDIELQACYISDGTPYTNDRLGCGGIGGERKKFAGAIEL